MYGIHIKQNLGLRLSDVPSPELAVAMYATLFGHTRFRNMCSKGAQPRAATKVSAWCQYSSRG